MIGLEAIREGRRWKKISYKIQQKIFFAYINCINKKQFFLCALTSLALLANLSEVLNF